ncbi:MAG: penicillin-binding protein 2 [Rhodospirillales bacterium]
MHRDSDRHKLFSRRMAMLAGGKFVLLSALGARLYYLQVVESDRYKTLADENRINFRLLPPPRGRIIDRNGLVIADNAQNYRVLMVSENTPSVENTLDILSTIMPISDNDRARVIRDMQRNKSFVPVTVRENLAWEQVAQIEVNTPDLPGVLIDVGQSRNYPFGEDFAHVLGYVAPVAEGEATGDPLLELPGFRIGKAGLEKVHDLALRGTGGNSQVEVNAYGRVIRELSRQEGESGSAVQLTIDRELQRYTANRLAGESASVTVLDVHNGEVLSLVSSPSFDPNRFNHGLTGPEWRALVNNPRTPLINKVIQGQYAPGSTFKMVVALAALERGIVTPDTEFFCSGSMTLGNAKFHCWKKHGHGTMNCRSAIMQSCDVYFYEVAKRVGIERIGAMARRLGLGDKLGIDLPGESAGLVPSDAWKRGAIGAPWQKGETVILGIGQGYILTTPLQLAIMAARIANGGKAIQPRLTRAVIGADGAAGPAPNLEAESLDIDPKNLALIRQAMSDVVNSPYGTAHRSKLEMPDVEMAGKTGTVQVRRISKAERDTGVLKNEDLPWEQRDHALFVAFAPVDKPRYAISVVVEHGGSGSRAAAPIARDVMTETLRRVGQGALSADNSGPRRGDDEHV